MVPLSVLLAAMALAVPQDAPRVSARISNTTPGVGETIILEVIVEGASGNVDIGNPAIPRGLDVVGTQDFTEMQLSLSGRRQTRRREFALLASAPGRYRIPPVIVNVGNQTYRTNALEIVVSGVAQTRSLESTDDAWLRAVMKPETVYVGQQSTLSVEAGFSEDLRVRLTRPPVFDAPSPTGFWVQDVPGGVSSRLRSVNGRITELQSLQRAYFPLSAGKFAFAPARVVIDVREGFLFAPETREIRSSSPKLVVLPLPEAGKPAGFKGAVGSYRIRAFAQPDTVAAGEAAQITIELSGHGNVKAAPQPVLPAIPGIEQFNPTEDATVVFDGVVMGGTKRFQWVIIPERSGRIVIPRVEYAMFDPASKSYRTVTTEPVSLVVNPSNLAPDDNGGGTALGALRMAQERPRFEWVRSPWFVAMQAIPLVAFFLYYFVIRARRNRSSASAMAAELERIRTAPSEYPDFLRQLESLIRTAASLCARDPALRTAETGDIGRRLRKAGVAEAAADRVVKLIQRIETERFAPSATQAAERAALLQEADQVMRLLNRAREEVV